MTEPRWEATGGGRWVWSWTGSGGHRYAVVQHRGGRPWRAGSGQRDGRGWHRGRHGPAGPVLPLLLLFVFATFSGAWFLSMLLFVLAFTVLAGMGAYFVGSALAGALRLVLPDSDDLPLRAVPAPRQVAVPVLPAPPYRISGGALAARDGVDLYRKRLLEVLKDRYVGGHISLAEFESRAARIAREPSARHLG